MASAWQGEEQNTVCKARYITVKPRVERRTCVQVGEGSGAGLSWKQWLQFTWREQ